MDEERGTRGNRMFYLATQPSAFAGDRRGSWAGWAWTTSATTAAGGGSSSRSRSGTTWSRRSGSTARSARSSASGRSTASTTTSGKETVRNLLVFRFGNGIFEPIWNRRHIDHVQITVAESIGIENRGAFYEETGASRDFLQNHLLQLLSLVAMEPPATFDADALRDEKVKVIRAVPELTPEQVATDVVRGQYGPGWVSAKPVIGYRQEAEVDPASETETFVAARLDRSTTGAGPASRSTCGWASASRSARPRSRSSSRRSPTGCSRDSATDPEPNLLAMRIQPDEGIMLRFGAKVPGLGIDIRNVTMDFTYGSAFQVDSPDAYETLILDVLLGDASLFTRADEVEEAWSIVDPIISPGRRCRRPTSRTTRPARGARRRPTTCSPARADGGEGSERPLMAAEAAQRRSARSSRSACGRRAAAGSRSPSRRSPASRRCAGSAARTRSTRSSWSWPDLGPAEPARRQRRRASGRHIAARTSVMNLVVVARQPEVGERAAETIQRLTGRHPSRTLIVLSRGPGRAAVARGADPGALRAAARGRARRRAPS